MRQLTVADQNAKTAGGEIILVGLVETIDDAGDAYRIVGTSPALAGKRQADLRRAVDVGEIPGLEASVRPSGADEYAELSVTPCSRLKLRRPVAELAVMGQGQAGVDAGNSRNLHGVGEIAHLAMSQKAGDFHLAGLTP